MECPKCQKYNNIDVISDCWNCGEHFTEELISIANKKEATAKVAEEAAAVIAKVAEEEAAVIAKVTEKEAAVIAKVAEEAAAVIAKVAEEEAAVIAKVTEIEAAVIAKVIEEATTGVGILSSIFIVMVQILFLVALVVSFYLMAEVNIITGAIVAISSILSCGLIFIMADILNNIAEINKKTKL